MKMYPGGSSGGLQFSLTTTAATFAGSIAVGGATASAAITLADHTTALEV